jgi:hypothetical protein
MTLSAHPSLFEEHEPGPPDLAWCHLCQAWHAMADDGYIYSDCSLATVKNAELEHEHAAHDAA